MTVVTRFAPSPTGLLHIGGARTALFNWLTARSAGGRFLLRIEDTDTKRSTPEAIEKIIEGLQWLGLDWDGDTVFQSRNRDRHGAVVATLLDQGHAYRCYCTPEELAAMRDKARAQGHVAVYDRRWRDRDPTDAPPDTASTVRIKMPRDGKTVIGDLVQGEVRLANEQLDDFILLRADGTPTYMLAVVVDDHDMGVTRIVRGDDHLNNAFRQFHLFQACGWEVPEFAHIPLIHGPDGAKLSKRHGALGVEAYRDMGFLPEAIRNYLLRLGWSHGDDEIISDAQAIDWFDIGDVNRGAARFDIDKLASLNGHYLGLADNDRLQELVAPFLAERVQGTRDPLFHDRLAQGLDSLKERARSLVELADASMIYCAGPPTNISEKARKLLDSGAISLLFELADQLPTEDRWDQSNLEATIRTFSEAQDLKLGRVAQPLRAVLTGSTGSPSIFEVMEILGREEVVARIRAIA
ncbi:MAG: glutamate--tRNA ligase [Alphaproteobacteria bacterium]|nr:glutamate--tRNA ligase [Alphaproteobacteria bacterium]